MSLPKRLKLAIGIICDDIMETTFPDNFLMPAISHVICASRSTITNFCVMASCYRENHIRISGYCEEWLDKYLEHDFFSLFRMTRETFAKLLNAVGHIRAAYFPIPQRFGGRNAISLEKSLYITLWYLAKGETIVSVSNKFNVTISSVYSVVTSCLNYIMKMMKNVIRWPDNDERKLIEQEFREIAGYPGVIGAIDGCHIAFKAPVDQHDSYQNRKFFHSINLQAICSASKIFTNIFVGFPGSANDARVFKNCTLYKDIQQNGEAKFLGEEYHLIGDSAYILLSWLMKPYDEARRFCRKERRHNFILSQTRVAIEHAFSLLKERWRILKYINVNSIERAVIIITVCCILHNFCIINEDLFETEQDNTHFQNNENYYEEDRQTAGKRKRDIIRDLL
ncbi:hypothetical protein NQ315_013977 [Exocentrus adspersus]|uniref:DDE Tnp4 domain-containing protein n=1 Tax=Exocentrus adspersus TaxID=1586481 RepID=A0AAV8VHM3_9CUCU|nr:hypothetical protein NQ315_013977 [Exocentrus adspersus]